MTTTQFNHLVDVIGPPITKQVTKMRKPISTQQRLAICLRYLATGDSFHSISFSYRCEVSTISGIVIETWAALWNRLSPIYMPTPKKDQWLKISSRFSTRWNCTNCIGATDGKQVIIEAPPNSGSLFCNYKGTFSLVLMAVVDADYRFVFVDIGSYGSNSDGGIFFETVLAKRIKNKMLDIPENAPLPGAEELGPIPHVLVGDWAFPLKPYLTKPYGGRTLTLDKKVFNYRLSRAQKIVENAFGILTQRWRIFQGRIKVDAVEELVKAGTVLHNYVQEVQDITEFINIQHEDGQTQIGETLVDPTNLISKRALEAAYQVSEIYKAYFNTKDCEVHWQLEMVTGRIIVFGITKTQE